MPPIIVAIAGGIASGKRTLANRLCALLTSRKLKTTVVDESQMDNISDNSLDCVLVHGSTLLRDKAMRERTNLKVFIDVDTDVRMGRILRNESECSFKYKEMLESLAKEKVLLQKKYADIYVDDDVNTEKLLRMAHLIEGYRSKGKEEDLEPDEIKVLISPNMDR